MQPCKETGKWKVVSVGSKAFPTKTNVPLSSYCFETLGLKWALERYASEIHALKNNLTIFTDNKALSLIMKLKKPTQQQAIVQLMLSPILHKTELRYMEAKLMVIPDFCSRFMSPCQVKKDRELTGDVWSFPAFRESIREDLISFPKGMHACDPQPEEEFLHRIREDGSIEEIANEKKKEQEKREGKREGDTGAREERKKEPAKEKEKQDPLALLCQKEENHLINKQSLLWLYNIQNEAKIRQIRRQREQEETRGRRQDCLLYTSPSPRD